ncbi:TPA: hypothetical protein JG832_002443 [Enterobacter hormaechei subsp. xiangfangensis]|nr:hypothetical protein [Enterobacter hormaechei subsp. xiangfangensis]HAV1890579.1 hypothetical protein [Enterobacter hormaechei subsp. xiangfangensis]
MTDQTVETAPLPTFDDVTMACESLVTGIRLCLKRITGDDIFKRRLEGMIEEISQLQSDVGVMLDTQASEYNELVDECEALQSSNGLQRLRITELEKELNNAADSAALMLESERAAHRSKREELEREIYNLTNSAEALQATTKMVVAEKRLLNGRLEDYLRMQPEKLKEQNAKLKLANADLTKTNSTLQTELNKLRKNHTRLQLDLARSESHAAELTADLNDFERFDDLINGEAIVDKLCYVSEKNPLIAFYPYIFKWGLNVWERGSLVEPTRRNERDLMFIQGLDFHIQIRSTLGMDLTCKICEFGRAIYLLPDELREHWPKEMEQQIQDFHLEQLERLSTPLYERALWCRDQHITTLDFVPEKVRQGFIDMGLDNLMMIGGCTYEEVKGIKGLGESTFYKIREGAINMLESYQHESGPILLTVKNPHTVPPMMQRIHNGIQKHLAIIKKRLEEQDAA